MSGLKVPKDLSADQYFAIEDSLQSTEPGRAFLRMRDRKSHAIAGEEFTTGLSSIKSWIEQAQERSAEEIHLDVLRKELMEMAASIRKAKSEISAMKPADDQSPNSNRRINLATEELDAIVQSTERATTDILNGAERIMEVSGQVRSGGLEREAEVLDLEATNILMACGFQDITGQRIAKVVSTLRYLEERVDAMIRIWGVDSDERDAVITAVVDTRPDAHLLHGPALTGGVDQSMVDALMNGGGADIDFAVAPSEAAPPSPVEPDKIEKPLEKPAPVAEVPAEIAGKTVAAAALDQSSIDSLFP
ncbi:MAG TPA: protein phosphatase CheZ [Aliidongia sp.]|nr:protein phosphatase CheZ [Aliidongia sp.]